MDTGTPISVLYEDEDLLAVNKPDKIPSIPDRKGGGDDLYTRLLAQCQLRLYVVHRLDREVSGVILFAKHAAAHRLLNEQFSQRTVQKTYRAVVHGQLAPESGQWDWPLRQFGSGRMGVDEADGKPSCSNYRVLENYVHHTEIEVSPQTGRRHQIRVHCYAAGHPVMGDLRYGDRLFQQRYPRLMLHSESISLQAPSGAPLTVHCPLSDSFMDILRTI